METYPSPVLRIPNRYMLDALEQVEHALPALLAAPDGDWNSLDIDYHAPRVERLWRDWRNWRVFLHRIHPCAPGRALLHPHRWPSAMKPHGRYEMGVGYGKGDREPPLAALIELAEGSAYQMIDPDAWHFARPTHGPALSVMVTGTPWDRPFHVADQVKGTLKPLAPDARVALLDAFRDIYRL